MDKFETYLNTQYATYNIFQGPRQIKAGFKFPAISIQWVRSIRDPNTRDAWHFFIDFIYIKHDRSAELDDIYDDTEDFCDKIWTECQTLNTDDEDMWGWITEIVPGHRRDKDRGFLQWVRVQAKIWIMES